MGTIKADYITGITGTETSGPITLSGDTATLGTGATIGSGVTGTLGSGVTFPAGHIIKHSVVRHSVASGSAVEFTIPFSGSEALVDFGSGKTLQLTGVTATEGNLLLISTGGFSWYQNVDATYATNLNVRIDGTIGAGWGSNWMNNPYTLTPVYFQTYYTVPADFTDKTIEFYAWKQTSNPGTTKFQAASAFGAVDVFVSVLEIQA